MIDVILDCRFGIDVRPALLDDVSCSDSQYQMIFQCTVSRIISSSCTDNNDISVTCCKFIKRVDEWTDRECWLEKCLNEL